MVSRSEDDVPGSANWIDRVIDDRYLIVKKLAEGAMGAVYVARHLKLNKEFAFKVVRPELVADDDMTGRFAREAMASSRIEHPNVVAAFDYGTLAEGGAYLVMQLVHGKSLAELLQRQGVVHWSVAADLGAQMADAIAAAWARGFVHRDLKPDNILLEPRDDGSYLVKILDFGVAKWARPSSTSMGGAGPVTQEGTVIGTPGYMAPEQALGQPASHVADLYSIGVVLWEAIVGRPLWPGDDFATITESQLRKSPPSLSDATGDATLPRALDRLVRHLLAVRPEHRPASAIDVRDTLRKVARRGREMSVVGLGPKGTRARVAAGRQRSKRRYVATAIMVAVGLSLVLFALWRAHEAPTTESDESSRRRFDSPESR